MAATTAEEARRLRVAATASAAEADVLRAHLAQAEVSLRGSGMGA